MSIPQIEEKPCLALVTLPYPQRRAELIAFVKKHHYSRRCPGVWSVCYALVNQATGKIQGVTIYGLAPYPSIARRFTYPGYEARMTWQARMVGAGISAAQLDGLIQYANTKLLAGGYWWVLTLTDPHARTIDGFATRLTQKGYSGQIYYRNGFIPLGSTTGKHTIEGWIIDNRQFVHARQGKRTLTRGNIRQVYPQATSLRCVYALPKQRWAYVLADTERERAERERLMRYRRQDWQPLTQPRLFSKLLPIPAKARLLPTTATAPAAG